MPISFHHAVCKEAVPTRSSLSFLLLLVLCGCDAKQPASNGQDTETSDASADTSWVNGQDLLSGNERAPGVQWLRVEPGSFVFGSPPGTPLRGVVREVETAVTLTRPFQMAQTEITQAQWEALDFPNPVQQEHVADEPIVFVNFFEAAAWCNKLSRLEGLEPCYNLTNCTYRIGTGCDPTKPSGTEVCHGVDNTNYNCDGEIHRYADWYACPGYRLPTTVEWEYAAKAGTTTHTYAGDVHDEWLGTCSEQPSLEDIAWYCNNSAGKMHPVGLKTPNQWGFYDMLGNVYEWVDHMPGTRLNVDDKPEPLVDPIGSSDMYIKETRGEYFGQTGARVRTAAQFDDYPFSRVIDTGFRPVRTIFE